MAERLARLFDRAVDASLRDQDPDALGEQLDQLPGRRPRDRGAGDRAAHQGPGDGRRRSELAPRSESTSRRPASTSGCSTSGCRHAARRPSTLKDAALRLGALNWGGFFAAQPDTPAKLAGFAYAFEHLEIAAYELLRRVARAAGDPETSAVAERILARGACGRRERFPRLFDAGGRAGAPRPGE